MASLDHLTFLALLLSALGVANAIRTLKDGPKFGPDGRQYKSALDINAEEDGGVPSSGTSTVSVECVKATMVIWIQADMFNNGRRVSPGDVTLGESKETRCRAVAVSDDEYVIEAGLRDCGSRSDISDDYVVYSNKLKVSLVVSYNGIARTINAAVPVSCRYKRYCHRRTHLESSQAPNLPLTFSTSKNVNEQSGFSLQLMADDWRGERFSNVFYLGDVLHLEASYSDPGQVPRQVFMDSCVATLEPDATSVPRYYLIENYGCLTDAKEEGSNAKFRSRTGVDVLQLHLDAFLFKEDPRNSIYITCQLKATTKIQPRSLISKACNYENSRWTSVDGDDDVCRCCGSDCYRGSPRWNGDTRQMRHPVPEDTVVCGIVTLGPMMIFHRK